MYFNKNRQSFLCLGLLGFLLLGCHTVKDKESPAAPKSQLAYRAKVFNQFLRWRSYKRAKELVAPGLRSKYMMKWEKERGRVNITGTDVRDITVQKNGKEAHVLVVHQRYTSRRPALKRIVFRQKWVAHEGVWFYVGKPVERAASKLRVPKTPVKPPVKPRPRRTVTPGPKRSSNSS